MKKIISAVLTVVMLAGTSTAVLAQGTSAPQDPTSKLTPEQKEARLNFQSIYLDKMTKLTDLRAQTKAAEEANNATAQQIKDKHKALASQQNKESIDKIKAVLSQNKDLESQAKGLNSQRAELRKQFEQAVKNRDAKTADDLKNKILDLNKQIEAIRAQVKGNIDSVKPLKEQLKSYKDSLKAIQDKVKPLIQQTKDSRQKIANEEKAKNALWQTFKSNIQAKDYTAAGNTLQSILDAKAQILSDIKARGEILNNILAAFNS